MHDPAQAGRQIGPQMLEPLRSGFQVLDRDGQCIVAAKRRLPREQVIHRDAQRIEIAARIKQESFDLLGAHVERRPHRDADLRQRESLRLILRGNAGQPKVRDLDLAFAREQDVFWLDIAMDDPALGRFVQRGGCLRRINNASGNSTEPRRVSRSPRFCPATYSCAM